MLPFVYSLQSLFTYISSLSSKKLLEVRKAGIIGFEQFWRKENPKGKE